MSKGRAQRWYYSNNLGQIRIHNTNRSLLKLVDGKPDDQTRPSLIAYREIQKMKTVAKDYISAQRAIQLVRNMQEVGFPKEIQIMQEMLGSADLTPVSTSLVPNQNHPNNLSSHHEIFECHWN